MAKADFLTKWVKLDPVKLDKIISAKIGETYVQSLASPYDVPVAARTYVDPSSRDFVLEFRYITESEPLEVIDKGMVKCHIGKNSHRIYGLSTEQSQQQDVRLLRENLRKAIDQCERASPLVRRANFRIAKQVISDVDELIKEEVHA